MPDDDLLFMPATRAAALIRRGDLSPVAYVDAVLAAIAHAQPVLNCFVTVDEEGARRDAIAAERAVASGAALGPLHGVPVHIKDLIDVAGLPTLHGSAIFMPKPPRRRATTCWSRGCARPGAIIIGKTTTPEFGVKGLTDGPAFGTTRNPWNLERTSRRLVRRRGGGGGGGARAARPRYRWRGVDPRAGRLLRPGRAEADAGRGAGGYGARRLRQQHLCRAAGTHGDGCGGHARHPRRPKRAGSLEPRRHGRGAPACRPR